MEIFTVVALTGASAAVFSVLISAVRLVQKIHAQRKLAAALRADKIDEIMIRLQRASNDTERKVSSEELQALVKSILVNFPRRDRDRILEGFQRPTEKAQKDYIERILTTQ